MEVLSSGFKEQFKRTFMSTECGGKDVQPETKTFFYTGGSQEKAALDRESKGDRMQYMLVLVTRAATINLG
jgi:hypothetical protein